MKPTKLTKKMLPTQLKLKKINFQLNFEFNLKNLNKKLIKPRVLSPQVSVRNANRETANSPSKKANNTTLNHDMDTADFNTTGINSFVIKRKKRTNRNIDFNMRKKSNLSLSSMHEEEKNCLSLRKQSIYNDNTEEIPLTIDLEHCMKVHENMIRKIDLLMKDTKNGRMRFFSPQRLIHKANLLTPKPCQSGAYESFINKKQYNLKAVFDRMKKRIIKKEQFDIERRESEIPAINNLKNASLLSPKIQRNRCLSPSPLRTLNF